MPAFFAIFGSRLVSVMPGIVLTSRTKGLLPLSMIRSTLVAPSQPRALCADRAASAASLYAFFVRRGVNIYSVRPAVYFAS